MQVTVASLSPPSVRGADAATAAHNAGAIAAAVRGLKSAEPELALVLLPSGGLSGGAGVPSAWPATQALAPLVALAAAERVAIAGAERFDGAAMGFLVTPDGGVALAQPAIGPGRGAAQVAVAETACGRVALLVADDLLHPEYARLALFSGAELLLNPCTERRDERSEARHLSRGARAWENHACVLVSSAGAPREADGTPSPAFSGRRVAEIWNFTGQLLVAGDDAVVTAVLDLQALRARRGEPWINFPAQLRTGLYAGAYAEGARSAPRIGAPPAPGGAAGGAPSVDAPAPPAYDVLMMQTHEAFIGSPEDRDSTIDDNLTRALGLARLFCLRPTTRLLVLPEFALQGSDGPHPQDYWERVGIRIPGPETARLGAFARECNVYVCAMVFEYDPEWPQRYFNTSVILSPEGEVILRYRKLQCADLNGLLNVTTPGNVFTRYVERYGYDALVPVVDTPIGRLGTLICYDANWPELWRALAMKGAEVICNPTSEIHSDRRPHWYAAKRAHAAENRVYVASANAGSEQFRPGAPVTGMNRGHSALIDFDGHLAACADGPGVVPLVGRIDLGTLRRARARAAARPGAFRADAVAGAYAAFQGFPLDCFLERPMQSVAEGPALVRAQLERLYANGVFRRA
jgi:predicted amidohydrolase